MMGWGAILWVTCALALTGCNKAADDAETKAGADRPASVGWLPSLDPDLAVILPAGQAMQLVRQCGRPSPANIERVWTPSAPQTAVIEASLPRLILDRLSISVGGKGDLSPADYYRQYAGVVIDGRQTIYVNGFHKSIAEAALSDWRQTPIISCSGGKMYFGVEYDVQTETFANFTFNGLG